MKVGFVGLGVVGRPRLMAREGTHGVPRRC